MTAPQHIFHPDGRVTLPWDPDPIARAVTGHRIFYADWILAGRTRARS